MTSSGSGLGQAVEKKTPGWPSGETSLCQAEGRGIEPPGDQREEAPARGTTR